MCNITGCEADDIISCWNIFNPEEKIIGIDKDYFQLPNVYTMYHHDFKEYHFCDAIDRLPIYIRKLADINFGLYQILLGDRADGIPRILEKGKKGKEQVNDILKSIKRKDLADTLYNMFEEKIIMNAKLVLFPFYEFSNLTNNNFFDTWCEGKYYNKENWSNFYNLINEKKRKVIYNQMTLFDF